VIIARECPAWCEGEDVREHYGIFKYVPPVRVGAGDAAADHPLFVSFTDVENLRNYTTVLEAGEPVIVTEKIHGTNSRVGIIEGEWMAGSMSVRRKQPETEAELAGSTYWFPTTVPGVRSLLEQMATEHRQCILFGEIYGSKIQDLHYGCRGALGYRAFDLLVDGKFVDTWFSAALPVPRRGLSTS
jgi:RNA ligase (TIGR02306 family)